MPIGGPGPRKPVSSTDTGGSRKDVKQSAVQKVVQKVAQSRLRRLGGYFSRISSNVGGIIHRIFSLFHTDNAKKKLVNAKKELLLNAKRALFDRIDELKKLILRSGDKTKSIGDEFSKEVKEKYKSLHAEPVYDEWAGFYADGLARAKADGKSNKEAAIFATQYANDKSNKEVEIDALESKRDDLLEEETILIEENTSLIKEKELQQDKFESNKEKIKKIGVKFNLSILTTTGKNGVIETITKDTSPKDAKKLLKSRALTDESKNLLKAFIKVKKKNEDIKGNLKDIKVKLEEQHRKIESKKQELNSVEANLEKLKRKSTKIKETVQKVKQLDKVEKSERLFTKAVNEIFETEITFLADLSTLKQRLTKMLTKKDGFKGRKKGIFTVMNRRHFSTKIKPLLSKAIGIIDKLRSKTECFLSERDNGGDIKAADMFSVKNFAISLDTRRELFSDYIKLKMELGSYCAEVENVNREKAKDKSDEWPGFYADGLAQAKDDGKSNKEAAIFATQNANDKSNKEAAIFATQYAHAKAAGKSNKEATTYATKFATMGNKFATMDMGEKELSKWMEGRELSEWDASYVIAFASATATGKSKDEAAIFATKYADEKYNLTHGSFVIVPIQRITKYELLLRDMKKYSECLPEAPEVKKELDNALELTKATVTMVNNEQKKIK